MSLLHLFDIGLKFFLIELEKSPVVEMVAIFEHDSGYEHQADVK